MTALRVDKEGRSVSPDAPTQPRIWEQAGVCWFLRRGHSVNWTDARNVLVGAGLSGTRLDAALLRLSRLDTASGDLDDTVEPSPVFGINKYRLPIEDADTKSIYGGIEDAIADMASAGSGRLRQPETGDLTWNQLRPTEAVLRPDRIRERLSADDWQAFDDARTLLVLAWIEGMQVTPCVFTWGGGGNLSGGADKGGNLSDPKNGDVQAQFDGASVTFAQLNEAKPDGHAGTVVATAGGWDDWYWSKAEVGHSPSNADRVYGKFAVEVYPDTQRSAYHTEVARRKALGLAMFGVALGEWLAEMDALFGLLGSSLLEVMPSMELGNEMSAYWFVEGDSGAADGGPQTFGWFCAILASAIRTQWPSARFRMGEQSEWGNHGQWPARLDWQGRAVSEGLAGFRDHWSLVLLVRPIGWDWWMIASAKAQAARKWIARCEELGLVWPPEGAAVLALGDLVHEQGFHWFHPAYPGPAGQPGPSAEDEAGDEESTGYVDEAVWLADAQGFKSVLAAQAGFGINSGLTFGAVGFPAEAGSSTREDRFIPASDTLQASVLVRRLLIARALGAVAVYWHTHMANLAPSDGGGGGDTKGWDQYSSMGVRQDTTTANHMDTFRASRNAIRRPSWYAFRRLVWLHQFVTDITVIESEDHLFALRLTSADAFRNPRRSWDTRVTHYRYAWVLWRDIQSSLQRSYVDFPTEVETFALVPDVQRTLFPTEDENGYVTDGGPNWDIGAPCLTLGPKFGRHFLWRNDWDHPYLMCALTNSSRVSLQ